MKKRLGKLASSIIFIASYSCANETSKLEEIKIIEETNNSTGYTNQFHQESLSGSKLGLTVKEIPASIEIINAKTMEERGDTTISQAITKATGIIGGESGHGIGGKFIARGFAGNRYPGITILSDGLKLGGSPISVRNIEVANLDRIEVLRGASSVLNGEGSIGATVNLITKKPSFTKKETELDFRLGSYDSYRAYFGTNGVAIEDVLAYRVDVVTREIGSNFDGEKREVDSLSTSFLYKINDNLITTLSIEKAKDDNENIYIGTPLVDGKLDKSVRKQNYNIFSDGVDKGDNLIIKHGTEWYANNNFEIKNQLYYQNNESQARRPYTTNQVLNKDKITISGADMWSKQDLIGDRFDVINKGDIFGLENRFLFGTDISKMNLKRDLSPSSNLPNPAINMYNPNKEIFGNRFKYREKEVDLDINQYAFYMEDQLKITDDLKLIAGMRYDILDLEWNYLKGYYATNSSKSKKHKDLSYRAGLVYDLTNTTTLYTSYATSIEPGASLIGLKNNQTDQDLTQAEQYEIGLRQSLFEDKAEFSISAYEINKKNMFINDPNNPGNVLSSGKQTSKGLEFNFGIKPIEQISVDANLSYTDAEFKGTYNYKKTPNSVPKYVGNLGLRYMPLSNIGIGTWIRYVDSFYINDANTVKLPSYTTVDLTLDYKLNKKTTFSFLLKNLTDEIYATTSKNDVGGVYLGEARSFEFGVNYKF
ncbi:TonB-dependent receptor [Aliarcobacter cryaerophilus]|uniref:TonB-dependent receptor n=1 Tax=Aliarcobacter cryaerophilus TaxID=28198 RepID=UPI003DA1F9E2